MEVLTNPIFLYCSIFVEILQMVDPYCRNIGINNTKVGLKLIA